MVEYNYTKEELQGLQFKIKNIKVVRFTIDFQRDKKYNIFWEKSGQGIYPIKNINDKLTRKQWKLISLPSKSYDLWI